MDRGQTFFFQWMEPRYFFHTWSRPEYFFWPKPEPEYFFQKNPRPPPPPGNLMVAPLEHSILGVTLDSRPVDEMSRLEPLEHLVLNASLDGRPMEEILVLEPLEHSVLDMALDSGLTTGDGGPELGPDRKFFSNAPRNEE